MADSCLLVTKFTIPPLRVQLLPRASLIERLNQDCMHPLVLLSAGAGYGKTTLLSAWASQRPLSVAWLTLDSLDNDPLSFWRAIVVALRMRLPMLGDDFLAQLQASQPPQLVSLLASLIDELEALGEEIVLIIDDYHVIEEQSIHVSLGFLLDNAPSCLHLVIASRIDPPLPLACWHARGQLAEIRDADLRLSDAETTSFLKEVMEVQLGKEEVMQLAERTEGWIAGLQLAALSLRGQSDPSAFVKAFSGSHRFILDYVREEILEQQPLAIQRFLMETAVLKRMNAALCRAVTGEQASLALLETLERANLFLVPLDAERQWYRFHPLFRGALLACLHVREPELMLLLHRRAAAWYAEQNLLHEAIPHGLEAKDFVYAADLIERFISPQNWRNEYRTLRRWLERFPREVLRARPDLSFWYAFAVILTSLTSLSEPSIRDLVEEPLQFAEQGYRETSNQVRLGMALTLRAVLISNQGEFVHAFALARQALTLLPEQDQQWRSRCLTVLGLEALLSGQLTRAQSLLQQALAFGKIARWLPVMLTATAYLGEMCFSRGELQHAAGYFRQALAFANEQQDLSQRQLMLETGARMMHYERLPLYSLAGLAYEWNKLEEAKHILHEVLTQGQFVGSHILTPGLLLQVRLLYACGEVEQAREFVSELAIGWQSPEVHREVQMCQAWLALKRGDIATVQHWAATYDRDAESIVLVRREEEGLLLARLSIAEGRAQEALDMLSPWKQQARAQERRHSELHLLVLETLAYEAMAARVQARETLLEAVTKAMPQGYQRLFLDEGWPMKTLLKNTLAQIQEQKLADYVWGLLHAFEQEQAKLSASTSPGPSALIEPLTPQERRVLRLLAEGASNQQIATQLVIQLVTVKKHMTNLLGKLGAANRTQAIVRAREYGLL